MGLRVPQNQIVESKYTSGKEYMFNDTYREYIGYYYELNGKLFAGKEFNVNAPELIKINSSEVNNLLTNPFTYIYGKISGAKITNNKVNSFFPITPEIKEILDEELIYAPPVFFYCKKITTGVIKDINEATYLTLQSDPLYVVAYTGTYKGIDQSLAEANKKIPGLIDWVTFEPFDSTDKGSTC